MNKWCVRKAEKNCVCCWCCCSPIPIDDTICENTLLLTNDTGRIEKEILFYKFINRQKATGQFLDIDEIIPELKTFNYQKINMTVIHTFFTIQLFRRRYEELELEWYWIIKKAQQWLDNKHIEIPEEMRHELINIIESFGFVDV